MAVNPEKARKQAITKAIRTSILKEQLAKATPYEKARYIQKRLRMQKKGYIRADQIVEFDAPNVAKLYPETFLVDSAGNISVKPISALNRSVEDVAFY